MVAGVAACNAVTGTGHYEIVDCPSGACGDGGSATISDAAPADSAPFDGGATGDGEGGVQPLPTCGAGLAPVRLIVTGMSGGSVFSNPNGLDVTAGSTQAACFVIDTIDLRTNGPLATWTGGSCKDGNDGRGRCVLDVASSGLTVSAALQ